MSAQDEAYQFTVDLWRFYKTFAFTHDIRDDLYWQQVVNKANELERRYGDRRIRHTILLDVIDALREQA